MRRAVGERGRGRYTVNILVVHHCTLTCLHVGLGESLHSNVLMTSDVYCKSVHIVFVVAQQASIIIYMMILVCMGTRLAI